MRTPALLALALVALAPLAASQSVFLPCSWIPAAGPVDTTCIPPIHPGAASNACTLNWVVTDGQDLYIGAALHCVGALGQRLTVEGAPGEVGTLAFRGRNDSAFFRIDAEDRALVSGALEGWGGPHAGPTGVSHRSPLPGETVLYYGHGWATEAHQEAHARAGTALYGYPTHNLFIFTGVVSGGDSGMPVMLATGEAVGHASAAIFVNGLVCGATGVCVDQPVSPVVLGVLFDTEVQHFERVLKKDLTLVTGRPTISTT